MTNYPIAIIAAIAKETSLLVSKLTNRQEEIYAGMQIYQGLLCNTPVIILQSGHGKVSATLGTATLIERYHAKFVISTGVAGALQSNITQEHIIIGNELAYHDSNLNALEQIANPIPAAPNQYLSDDSLSHLILKTAQNLYPKICHEGLIVSGDTLY